MPVFTIKTPRGDEVDIDAPDEAAAVKGAQDWDHKDYATSEAQRMGVNPDLVLRQMHQESGGNANALSPKGARGPMQLMPATAKQLGVDPTDPYQNISGGITYLKQNLDRYGGDEAKALAAYNAGPGAVDKYGGVPPYRETQNYVRAIQGAPPVGFQPAPMAPTAPAKKPVPPDAQRTSQLLGLLKGGFAAVDNTANHAVDALQGTGAGDFLARSMPDMRKVLPQGVANFIQNPQAFYDAQAAKGVKPGKIGEFAGNVASTAWVPGGPLVQGAVQGALLSEGDRPLDIARDAAFGGVASKFTGAGLDLAGKGLSQITTKALPTMDTAAIQAAKTAAYQAVDDMGARFKRGALKPLVQGIQDDLNRLNFDADLNPKVAGVLKVIGKKVSTSPTVSEIDNLLKLVGTNLYGSGSTKADQMFGSVIKTHIDEFLGAKFPNVANGDPQAAAATLKEAKRLAQRGFKMTDIEGALESATNRAANAGSGGNIDNVIRQQIRPLLEKGKGWTDEEKKALTEIVRGTKTQNLLRTVGRLSPTNGMIPGAFGIASSALGGVPGAAIPTAGYAAKELADALTKMRVQNLLRLVANGGTQSGLRTAEKPTVASIRAALAKAGPMARTSAAVAAVNAAQGQ